MSRFISILLTIVLGVQILLSQPDTRMHLLFPLIVFGLLLGLLHSLDFSPSHPIRKHVFGPTFAWPIMAGGIFYFLTQSGII
jgi:predicted membrane protein